MRIWLNKTVDEEFADLGTEGYTGSLNDRQFAKLAALGYSGALGDKFALWGSNSGDTTSPVVITSSYDSGTGALDLDITEASGSATCYWALVDTGIAVPTEAAIVAGSGTGVVDAGNFTVTSGGDSDIISYVGSGNELHLVIKDASGNSTGTPSLGANTIITGIGFSPVTYTESWSSYSNLDNWTQLDAAYSRNASITTTEVRTEAGTPGGLTLAYNNTSAARAMWRDDIATVCAADEWTYIDALVMCTMKSTTGVLNFGYYDYAANKTTGVLIRGDGSTWNARLANAIDAGTTTGYTATGLAYDADYWFRIRIDQTTVYWKYWLEGDAEPGSWTGSAALAVAPLAVQHISLGLRVSGTAYWHYYAVGFDEAPVEP